MEALLCDNHAEIELKAPALILLILDIHWQTDKAELRLQRQHGELAAEVLFVWDEELLQLGDDFIPDEVGRRLLREYCTDFHVELAIKDALYIHYLIQLITNKRSSRINNLNPGQRWSACNLGPSRRTKQSNRRRTSTNTYSV